MAALVPAGLVALVMLFGMVNSLQLASGAFQVLSGRPSLLTRVAASIRMRLPATPTDCVLHGAGQVLQAAGLFVGIGPLLLPAIATMSEFLGGPQMSPLGRWPTLAFAFLVYAVGSLAVAITCVVVSYALSLRVRYVIDDGAIRSPG